MTCYVLMKSRLQTGKYCHAMQDPSCLRHGVGLDLARFCNHGMRSICTGGLKSHDWLGEQEL